ncbi:D-alanyl-D-alanine carboxypeptidase, partial [Myxococcota bacterium]|nr:D-alanyl-D-alanine carboxypeptidase [Myxococcota bacterium]
MHKSWEAGRSSGDLGSALSMESKWLVKKLEPIMLEIEKRATISIHVRDLRSQHVLVEHRATELRNPASNQKMLTAAASLDLLGPEYRFETQIFQNNDTLYLVGSGDPSLTV